MSWYDYPPYTTYQTGTDKDNGAIYKGIFYVILAKMFDDVCGQRTKVFPSYFCIFRKTQ